jgi:signal transduction histidine kinase
MPCAEPVAGAHPPMEDTSAEAIGERKGTRARLREALGRQAGPWRVVLFAGLPMAHHLGERLSLHLGTGGHGSCVPGRRPPVGRPGVLITASMASLPLGRRLAVYAVVALLALLLTRLLASLPGRLSVTTDVLAVLVAVIAAAAAVKQQRLAAAIEAARPVAEADRMRTALLAAVSHDLRTPLAAGRRREVTGPAHRSGRQPAGREPATGRGTTGVSRPADLGEIIAHSPSMTSCRRLERSR